MHTRVRVRMYWIRHLTFFNILVFISWMITLSSCMIWQIISFILPPNEYGCVYAWTTLEKLRRYFENHGNVAECVRKLSTDFGRREAPSAAYIGFLVKKVKETAILIDKPKREKPKTVHTPKNIAAVAESVCGAPSTSIHRRSHQLNISESHWGEFCIKTLVWRHTKFKWFRSWS